MYSWKSVFSVNFCTINTIEKILYVTILIATVFLIYAMVEYRSYIIEHHEAFRSFALILAGIIGIPLLYIRSKSAQKQAEVAESDSQSEVFLRSVAELSEEYEGLALVERRIGGMLELELLAKRNIPHYGAQVIHILSEYVCLNARYHQDRMHPTGSDIKAAIETIGRLLVCVDVDSVSLSNIYLEDVYFHDIDLSNVRFSKAVFNNVHFKNVGFIEATFYLGKYTVVNFVNCDFSRASFVGMICKSGWLSGNFSFCSMDCISIEGGMIKGENIKSIKFEDSLGYYSESKIELSDEEDSKYINALMRARSEIPDYE